MDKFEEVFKLDIETYHKVKAKISTTLLLVSVVEGDYSSHRHVLYIYNMKDAQYVGFVKLSELLGIKVLAAREVIPIDFDINDKSDLITVVAG